MSPEELAEEFARLWAVRRRRRCGLPRRVLTEMFGKIGASDMRSVVDALLMARVPGDYVLVDDLDSPEDDEWSALGASQLDWLLDVVARGAGSKVTKARHERDRPVKRRRDQALDALMTDLLLKRRAAKAIIDRAEAKCIEWETDERFNPNGITLKLKRSTLERHLRDVQKRLAEK